MYHTLQLSVNLVCIKTDTKAVNNQRLEEYIINVPYPSKLLDLDSLFLFFFYIIMEWIREMNADKT